MLRTERMESRPFASVAIDRLGEPSATFDGLLTESEAFIKFVQARRLGLCVTTELILTIPLGT
jgi:hypothetical protein